MQRLNGNFFYQIGQFFGFRRSKQAQKQFFDSRIPIEILNGKLRMSTDVPYDLYNSILELKAPIDKLAAMFSNGVFKYQRTGATELEDLPKDLAALLENPNIFQGQNAWMKQYLQQLIVYGNQFIYKNQPSKVGLPKSIMNVSPSYLEPILTGNIFDQIDMSGVVSSYEYSQNGQVRSFETPSVMWSKISDLDNPIQGCSPLLSLKFPISNTELAYKYLNVISGEKGAIGILSANPKDNFGAIPLSTEEKKQIENTYRQENGIEDYQKKIAITSTPMKWDPITYPTKDLLLLEQIDANFKAILNQLGVNMYVFVNSTYENLKHGLVATHNDTVMPYADAFTQELSKFIGIKGGRLVLDYSHLPYLQKDKKEAADTVKTIGDSLTALANAGIVSVEAAQQIMANTLQMKPEDLQSNVNELVKALGKLSPLVANNVLQKFTINETRSMVGLSGVKDGDVIPSQTTDNSAVGSPG